MDTGGQVLLFMLFLHKGRFVARVLVFKGCTYSEGGEKKSQIVVKHQCAKCSSGHMSRCLKESAPMTIHDLSVGEVNV